MRFLYDNVYFTYSGSTLVTGSIDIIFLCNHCTSRIRVPGVLNYFWHGSYSLFFIIHFVILPIFSLFSTASMGRPGMHRNKRRVPLCFSTFSFLIISNLFSLPLIAEYGAEFLEHFNSIIFFFFSTLNSNPSPINVEWRLFPHILLFPLLVLNFFSELAILVLSIKRASLTPGSTFAFNFYV